MRKICIIHFVDIERYPPAINLLRYLDEHAGDDVSIDLITTTGTLPLITGFHRIKVHRLAGWKNPGNRMRRFLMYVKFNLWAVLQLIRIQPVTILYFETLSAGPAWFYKTFLRGKASIFVHYHEYVTKMEYANGMVLSRWLHEKEKRLYPLMRWVSHTNKDRMELFLDDLNGNRPTHTYIIPNYPPKYWRKEPVIFRRSKIRFVYVGAASLETMYVKEMCEFVLQHERDCSWDIFSSNASADVRNYIDSLKTDAITFKGGVPYDRLPEILTDYDVGLVLYHGHIANYVYNVPNKLFEYHVCGLDTWFPVTMKSPLAYQTERTYPKIVAIDFTKMDSLDLFQLVDRTGMQKKQFDFYCEEVFKPLTESLAKPD